MRFARLVIALIGISAVAPKQNRLGATPTRKRRAEPPSIRSIAPYATAGIFKEKPELRSRARRFGTPMVRERQRSSMTFSAVRCLWTLPGA